MALWTPPNADLGEFDGPRPDPRMRNFIGGFDANGQPVPITYSRMRSASDDWLITSTTPDGPANLLKAAKDMFALGFYSYELIASSCAWSITAVEAALKLRLAEPRYSFDRLIKLAVERDLIAESLADILDAGRQIRNRFVHEGTQPLWTLGMASNAIGTSFKVVSELYP
jgi:hypothetical protein